MSQTGSGNLSTLDRSRQAKSIPVQLSMFDHLTLPDLLNAISSPALADGRSPCAIAGWADDRPVWTGSCPCQPFSAAGQRKGTADARHLWPEFRRLIAECQPPIVFGEQVASKDGRGWLAGVRADLEALGFAVGAADLCAAGFGAPQIRQRLYWVADADQTRWRDASASQATTERDGLGADGMGGRLSHWSRDGKQTGFADGSFRRTKPGVGILVDGFPGRVATVGGFGNAIVPQVAAGFIEAFNA